MAEGPTPLVPLERLQGAKKILFATRLALGDYAYLRRCLLAFSRRFPEVKIHLWIDDTANSWRWWRWKSTRQDALYAWLAADPFIAKVHAQPDSIATMRRNLRAARDEDYPIYVGLSTVRPWLYAWLAARVAPNAFRVGAQRRSRHFDAVKQRFYRGLHAALPVFSPAGRHISDVYAERFAALFGVEVSAADRHPAFDVPAEFADAAAARRDGWNAGRPLVFLNPFSKVKAKSWSLERTAELIAALRARAAWRDGGFVVNVAPSRRAETEAFFAARGLPRVHPFSAEKHFFELPAMMARCDLVVSVDTATMHLANAVRVPLVGLMRGNNPEWAPIDREHSLVLTPETRGAPVATIGVATVVEAVERLAAREGQAKAKAAIGR